MAESKDQRPPKPGFTPGGYLPRVWRAEPEPPAEVQPGPGKKRKKKGATDKDPPRAKGKAGPTQDDENDGVKKGVLLEETPHLDTIEARRKARLIMGSVASLILVIVVFLIVRVFTRSPSGSEHRADERVFLVDPRLLKDRNETEARSMMEHAREAARGGRSELALSLLSRITSSYPDTKSATAARQAIGRSRQNLSLFADIKVAPQAPGASSTNPEPSPSQTQAVPPAEKTQVPPIPKAQPQPSSNPEAALAAISPAPPVQLPTATTAGPPGRPLPAGFQARTGVGLHPSGWPLEITGGPDSSVMVLVPGSTFVMGRDGGDPAEAPAHRVKVSTFYIDKHEVTNRQFDQFVKATGPRADRDRALSREGGGVSFSEDSPVILVSARDARDFADWAGKRLPTEAQWELAARGTDHRLYPWGPLPPVWERPRAPHQIDAVMSFPSDISPYGAYDMAGNAMEWTRDWFEIKYYASFQGAVVEEPTGPVNRPASLQMTVRGGSKQWIVTAREGMKFETRLPFLGFRCAIPVDGPESVFLAPPPLPTTPRPAAKKKAPVPF